MLCGLIGLLYSSIVTALEITEEGSYTINSNIDTVSIHNLDARSSNTDINIVSGGYVSNIYVDSFRIGYSLNVSGNGYISNAGTGMEAGTGIHVTLRDQAVMRDLSLEGFGSDSNYLGISDNAQLGHLVWFDGGILEMTGGYIGALSGRWPEGHLYANITGGIIGSYGCDISNYCYSSSHSNLVMSGGRIIDGLTLGGGQLNLKGGDIFGGIHIDNYEYNSEPSIISRGHVNTTNNEYLIYTGSDFLISGGSIGNINSGLGFYLYDDATFDIRGYDLALVDGLLSGYLLDHSRISVQVNVSESWTGSVNLHNVPEPATLALLGLGVASIGFTRRKRR